MTPRIVLLYAALLGLILVYLSYRVVSYRVKYKVGIGDGGNTKLARAIRVQGNFVEYVPIALLLILPLALLSQAKIRNNPQALYWTCVIVVMGFITNRINVSINAVDAMTGADYYPKWPELALTAMVLTAGVIIFRTAVIYLDIVPKREPAPKMSWVGSPAEA